MGKLTLNLPLRYRVDLRVVQIRDGLGVAEPFFPRVSHLKSYRTGNKISRVFRHMAEHKRWNRVIGSNIAAIAIATTAIPTISAQKLVETTPEVIQLVTTTMKTERGLQLPVKNVKVNQGFYNYHPGVDLGGRVGDSVYPIMTGRVEYVGKLKYDYGNHIIINHTNGISSLYAHLSKIMVKEGDTVQLDTVIGEVGSTGRSTGPHLHLEVRNNGRPMNPFSVLPLKTTQTAFTSILQSQ